MSRQSSFQDAAVLSPQFAELHFRLGQCFGGMTNIEAARRSFERSDLDTLPFRADTRINRIIEEVASQYASSRRLISDAGTALAGVSSEAFQGTNFPRSRALEFRRELPAGRRPGRTGCGKSSGQCSKPTACRMGGPGDLRANVWAYGLNRVTVWEEDHPASLRSALHEPTQSCCPPCQSGRRIEGNQTAPEPAGAARGASHA